MDLCCVCEKLSEKLDCSHCLCESCLKKVRKDQCPICRVELKGSLVTNEILRSIRRKMKKDKKKFDFNLGNEISPMFQEEFLLSLNLSQLLEIYLELYGEFPQYTDVYFMVQRIIQP